MIHPYRFLKIRPEDRELGTIGSETADNIGNFLKDQYERIPEDKRQGFEQGVSEAATGIQEWNKQLREENYHGGIGPLDPFIAAGKAYNFVAEPIKKELSIQTGLAPAWIEAVEVAADFLLPAIPLTAASKGKKLKKAVDYTNRIKNVSNVLDDTTSLNKKIRKILATNSQMSYGQARDLALLELKGVHPTRKLYRDRPDRGGLMDGAPIDEQSMWNAQKRLDDGYIEEIVEQGDNVIYPPGSKEADILANTKAMAADIPIEDTIRRGSKGEVVQNPFLTIYKREDAAWIGQGLQSAVPAKPTAATKWDHKMDDIYKLFTGQDPDLPTAGAKELQKIKLHRAKGSKDPKFIKHHPAPLAHVARSLDYLTDDGVRAGADYLSRKIGTPLGDFQPGTLAEEMFHSKMHRFLDDKLGSSKGGLLYKLEKKYFGKRRLKDGISLQERIDSGFMDELADVLVEQKGLIDDWYRALANRAEFKKVSLEEYVNEAAETIKLNKVLKDIASGKRTRGLGASDLIDRVIGLENKELRDTMKDLLQYKEIDDILLSDEARNLKNLNLYKAKEQFLLELMNMDWAGGKLDAAQQVFKLIDEYDLPFTKTDQNMIDDLVDALERIPIEESLDPKVAKEIKEWLGRD